LIMNNELHELWIIAYESTSISPINVYQFY
jgi:hypothetical protein